MADSPSLDLAAARRVLRERFGYPDFRPGQDRLVAAVLAGRDALGILPTGGGKTVCYQVPALLLGGLTVVVSPLISLMDDQVDRARAVGLRAVALNATLSTAARQDVLDRCRRGTLDLVLVSPERFGVEGFVELLPDMPIRLVAVDEAHCISEWGHDFRPAYRSFGVQVARIGCPVLALTATATPPVRRDIVQVLSLRRPVRVVGSFDRPNLRWSVLHAGGHGAKADAIRRAVRSEQAPCIVYAGTRRTVEALRRDLAGRGFGALAYHAGLEADQRRSVQASFMAGDTRVVVATNAFGMGIDKADVRLVIHYQLSSTMEGYYQEAGRAGRDGAPARCVALHGPDDLRLHRAFVDRSRPPAARVGRVWRRLHRAGRAGGGRRVGVSAGEGGWPRLSHAEADAAIGALSRQGVVTRHEEVGGGPSLELGLPDREPDLRRVRALRAEALEKLAAVERYALATGCRRNTILAYFGESGETAGCGRCDNCRGGPGGR